MDEELRRELQSLRMAIEGLTQVVLRQEAKSKGGLAGAQLPELTALTARQHAVLQGIVYSIPNDDVAKIMGGISIETVKTHARQVGKKMGVTKRNELRVMGQKFLEQGAEDEYRAATGGFGKAYMMTTDPDGDDDLRPLVAPLKVSLVTS